MKPKDPIWNFVYTLNDKNTTTTKITSVKSLDCNAEVSAKVLRLMMCTLGRDETVSFQNLVQYISAHHKNITT